MYKQWKGTNTVFGEFLGKILTLCKCISSFHNNSMPILKAHIYKITQKKIALVKDVNWANFMLSVDSRMHTHTSIYLRTDEYMLYVFTVFTSNKAQEILTWFKVPYILKFKNEIQITAETQIISSKNKWRQWAAKAWVKIGWSRNTFTITALVNSA